ncbi:hypothetical protein CBS101457_005275 [Exobasidium rhododendri]|nr:hypothetical protein CBS101457_005275 [Exobasidium rhododendri]
MFRLKYTASHSSPSLSSSAEVTSPSTPTSPCLPSRSSGNALSALQQQRQQQQQHHRSKASTLLTAGVRSTSLLPVTPRRPAPPTTSSPKTTRSIVKSSQTASVETHDRHKDATMVDESLDAGQMPFSFSQQSVAIPEEKEEEGEEDWGGNAASQNVVVCVRVRPGGKDCKEELWTMDAEKNRIVPTDQHPSIAKRSHSSSSTSLNSRSSSMTGVASDADGSGAYDFRFDSLVLPSMNTDAMYEANISPIIDAVVGGYNGTVFAYGQTGSGKTHTMSGSDAEKGVIPRAVEEIFEKLDKDPQREFLLRVSYLEIYNETLKDLLAPYPSSASSTDLSARPSSPIKGGSSHVAGGNDASSLRILESSGRIQIQGLREEIVTNAGEVLNLLEWGQRGRHQAATDWNERSSRSHCVFILTLESREQKNSEGKDSVRFSQLNLIDLAGSERAASEKERRKEGAFINKSLLTLGTVIAKLSEQSQTGNEDAHIPYRDSKLTRLLQTSLGGNARVAVVCTLSPKKEHGVESLSTLRFGQRCKMVVTKAKRGTIMNDKALIARYRRELERLRSQLEQGNTTITMADASVMPVAMAVMDDASMKVLQSKREEAEMDVRKMNEKRDELKKQVERLTRLILTGKDVAAEGQNAHHRLGLVAAGARGRRAGRMSDLGTSSPSKRARLFDDPRDILRDSLADQENIGHLSSSPLSSIKPFALEGELASLKKNLSIAMMSKKASEEARIQETQLWRARVMELEANNTEQEEELDEAEIAFEKLKNDRDALRSKVEEEMEANRLLTLVAQSRGVAASNSEAEEGSLLKLDESQREVQRLEREWKMAMERNEELKRERDEEIRTLNERLAASQTVEEEEKRKSNQILALQQQLESYHSSKDSTVPPHEPGHLVAELREQLRAAKEGKEQAERELQAANLERGQEDAERDFADLVKVDNSATSEAKLKKEIASREKKLEEKNREIEELQKHLAETKQKSATRSLPVPPSPAASPLPDTLRSVMEKQIKLLDERSKALEEQVYSLKVELKARSASEGGDSERQVSRIAALEAQLLEAKSGNSIKQTPGSPLKESFVNEQDQQDDDDDESAPSITVPAKKIAVGGRLFLQRGGSMREFKRYSASNELPSTTNMAMEQVVKAERGEIERLNHVITSQRGIMSDLEASVAAWKGRLRLQHDIIARLVEAGGVERRVNVPELPSVSSDEQIKRAASPVISTFSSSTSPLMSGSVSSSTTNLMQASNSTPYYGAHTYNRPPTGLGLGSASPTKGTAWLATMPGLKPEPLPLANGLLSSPTSRAKRRKTIEHEIEELKGSPRVRSTTDRLLETKAGRPLPVPGSPAKLRSSKDYYI